MCTQKDGKFDFMSQKLQMARAGNLHKSHWPKICSNPNIFACSSSLWTGASMHRWLYGWNMSGGKVPAIQTSHTVKQFFLFFSGITVFVSLSTFQFTILLLKSLHFRLHCHALMINGLLSTSFVWFWIIDGLFQLLFMSNSYNRDPDDRIDFWE